MSIAALRWAREQRTGNPGRKLVLMALADFADTSGVAYPSQETIAEVTEQGVRTVRDHLSCLEVMGMVSRDRRHRDSGARASDGYRLNLPAESAGSDEPDLPAKTAGSQPAKPAGSHLPAKIAGSERLPAKPAGRPTGEKQQSYRRNLPVEQPENGNYPEKKENPPSGVKRKNRATQLPDDWNPNAHHAELARAKGVVLGEEAAHFKDHHLAKGSTFKDWDRAFNTWLRRAKHFRGGSTHPDSQAAKVKAGGPAAEKPRSATTRQGTPEPNGSQSTAGTEAQHWAAEHPKEFARIRLEILREKGLDEDDDLQRMEAFGLALKQVREEILP